jgi:hypothetical protein
MLCGLDFRSSLQGWQHVTCVHAVALLKPAARRRHRRPRALCLCPAARPTRGLKTFVYTAPLAGGHNIRCVRYRSWAPELVCDAVRACLLLWPAGLGAQPYYCGNMITCICAAMLVGPTKPSIWLRIMLSTPTTTSGTNQVKPVPHWRPAFGTPNLLGEGKGRVAPAALLLSCIVHCNSQACIASCCV